MWIVDKTPYFLMGVWLLRLTCPIGCYRLDLLQALYATRGTRLFACFRRLRELITSEEDMYMQEMADKEETLLERQARMRDRARTLREKRERERAAEAERRLEQRWR